jgi:NAD(P)-dependent dehydrogenase (short-subunit alcohol dehydrogenase family)
LSPLAVVTGTTHGIGRVTAIELARAGYAVAMLCRNVEAAAALQAQIAAQVPHASVRVIHCDLSSLQSVRACAQTLQAQFDRIALLINNAGMVSTRRRMSIDGFELTFATNHLGPFLLSSLLLDRMAAPARIINVASRAHLRGKLDLERVRDPRARYSGIEAYAGSKLANVLFTFALARRLAGRDITTNCLHPGVVATNLLPAWLRLVKPLISRVIFDVERGARTTLYLALAERVGTISGCYFDEHQQVQTASPLANDVELQESLWRASERWTCAGS